MRKRCIRQSVLIVEKIVKFRSNLIQADLSTVEIAILKEDHQEEDFRLG
jgi:hypothetical protein